MDNYMVKKITRMSEEFIENSSLVESVLYYNSRKDSIWASPVGEIDSHIGFEDLMLGRYDNNNGLEEFLKNLKNRLPKLKNDPEYLEAQGVTLSMLRDSIEEQYELLIDSKIVKHPFDKKVKNTFGNDEQFFNWIKESITNGLNVDNTKNKKFELMSKVVSFIYPSDFLKLFKASGCLKLLKDCVKSNLKESERYIIQSRIMTTAVSNPQFLSELNDSEREELLSLTLKNKDVLQVWLPVGAVDRLIDQLTIRGYAKLMDGSN